MIRWPEILDDIEQANDPDKLARLEKVAAGLGISKPLGTDWHDWDWGTLAPDPSVY